MRDGGEGRRDPESGGGGVLGLVAGTGDRIILTFTVNINIYFRNIIYIETEAEMLVS